LSISCGALLSDGCDSAESRKTKHLRNPARTLSAANDGITLRVGHRPRVSRFKTAANAMAYAGFLRQLKRGMGVAT